MSDAAEPSATDQAAAHPFEALSPDTVLQAVESLGWMPDGRLTALNSYENRVYLVHLDEWSTSGPSTPQGRPLASVVLKFYRPARWSDDQILEEHRFAQELSQAEVPVAAPITVADSSLHRWQGFSFSASPCWGGRRPELDDLEVLEWIGRFLARIHQVGARQPFEHRPRLTLEQFGTEPVAWLLAHESVPLDVRSAWTAACRDAIELIAQSGLSAGAAAQNYQEIRLHGDCHPGNILWTPADLPDGGPHFVDLDDARSGPAVQDLWMLLSGERPERTLQLSALLDGYEQLRAFDRRELALIEPLRTLRLIHYSAWLARRWQDPIFPRNFPWFGSSDYWQGQVQQLVDQIEAMQAPALLL